MTATHPLYRDTTELRVTAPGDTLEGTFILMYLHPETNEYVLTEPIAAGCSAADLKNAIGDYYRDLFGTRPDVALACEDDEGPVSCSGTDGPVVHHIYTITVPRSISIASSTQLVAVPLDT